MKNLQVLNNENIAQHTINEFLNRGEEMYREIIQNYYNDRISAILGGKNPPPYEIEIQPSSKCNAGCLHCWSKEYAKVKDKITSKRIFDFVIDQIMNFKQDGFQIEAIKFCGSTGDPLMNPYTRYAIERINGYRKTIMYTNGIKIGENLKNRDYLSSIAKIDYLNLSLDAATSPCFHHIKPGSKNLELEKILEGASKLRELSHEKIQIVASFVIGTENYKEIPLFAKKIKEYKAAQKIRYRIDLVDRSISKLYGKEVISLLKNAMEYEGDSLKIISIHKEDEIKEIDKNHFNSKNHNYICFLANLWTAIGADLKVYPCGHNTNGNTETYGNLLENSLEEIWNGSKRIEVMKKLPCNGCSICPPFGIAVNKIMTAYFKDKKEPS